MRRRTFLDLLVSGVAGCAVRPPIALTAQPATWHERLPKMEFLPTDARRIFEDVVREPGPAVCRVAAYVARHSAICGELAASLALEARRAKRGAAAMAA